MFRETFEMVITIEHIVSIARGNQVSVVIRILFGARLFGATIMFAT